MQLRQSTTSLYSGRCLPVVLNHRASFGHQLVTTTLLTKIASLLPLTTWSALMKRRTMMTAPGTMISPPCLTRIPVFGRSQRKPTRMQDYDHNVCHGYLPVNKVIERYLDTSN